MKIRRLAFLLVPLLLASCASQSSTSSNSQTRAAHTSDDDSDKPPFNGMTKAQALARYGEPRRQLVTDEGETWFYVLNEGTVFAKSLIPFYFGGRDIKTGTLVFGPDGRVRRFTWDTQAEN